MIAVADTSPISALIRIGKLPLLGCLFEQVVIPPEVAAELEDGIATLGNWQQAEGAGILSTRSAANQLMTRELSALLHSGEAAAVAMAAEVSDSILVIDELEGRRVAARLGIRHTGTVGLIVAAKRQGHVASAGPLLQDLREKAKLWLSEELIRHALQLTGELS